MPDLYQTPQMKMPGYLAALSAFETGEIITASRADLQNYLLAISQNVTGNDGIQARDIAQVLTLNHLVLQRHIDDLERKSKITQVLVVALTIASLAGTVAQAWLAYKADVRSESEIRKPIAAVPADPTQPVNLPFKASSPTLLLLPEPSKTSAPSNSASAVVQKPPELR